MSNEVQHEREINKLKLFLIAFLALYSTAILGWFGYPIFMEIIEGIF